MILTFFSIQTIQILKINLVLVPIPVPILDKIIRMIWALLDKVHLHYIVKREILSSACIVSHSLPSLSIAVVVDAI